MSGIGHPESADITGLTFDYMMQQMKDFKSGDRKDWARMNGIAKELTDEETTQALMWMASLKPRKNNSIVEMDTVPKTIIAQGRMRFIDPAGGTEPVGVRILTVPVNPPLARLRDPNTAFMSYVAVGTLARGQQLVEKGDRDKTIVACGTCHAKTMTGQVMPRKDTPGIQVPGIAGRHPMYLTRELHLFKDGLRGGDSAKLMMPTVKNMTDESYRGYCLAGAVSYSCAPPWSPRGRPGRQCRQLKPWMHRSPSSSTLPPIPRVRLTWLRSSTSISGRRASRSRSSSPSRARTLLKKSVPQSCASRGRSSLEAATERSMRRHRCWSEAASL
jgi:cytochrome c553